jgi:hypothetical protein
VDTFFIDLGALSAYCYFIVVCIMVKGLWDTFTMKGEINVKR